MAWVKLATGFGRHPKVLAAGDAAAMAHLRAMCWAAEAGTDGRIPPEALPIIPATRKQAERLEEVGLWECNGNGWVIHDWRDFNVSAEQSKNAVALARERKKKWRQEHRNGDA
jgi:hypothetical protein